VDFTRQCIFSVDASNSFLGLWCRYWWNMRVLSSTQDRAVALNVIH